VDGRLVGREILQWDESVAVLVIVKDHVTLAERAARAVLPAQAHGMPLDSRSRKREGFRR